MKKRLWMGVCAIVATAGMVQADLVNRFKFEDNPNDSVGSATGAESGNSTYLEAPSYVTDAPIGAVSGAPTKALQVGMSLGTKKSYVRADGLSVNRTASSYSLWMKADSMTQGQYAFNNDGTKMFTQGTDKIKIAYNGFAGGIGMGAALDDPGGWNHVAVTWYSPSNLTFYVNGALVGSVSDATLDPNIRIWAVMGTLNSSDTSTQLTSQFAGRLWDVQFYDTELSSTEVAGLYNSPGSVIPEPATLGMLGLGAVFTAILRRRRAV